MKVIIAQHQKALELADITIYPVFQKIDPKAGKEKKSAITLPKELQTSAGHVKSFGKFQGELGSHFAFNDSAGNKFLLLGLGDKNKVKGETLRQQVATAWRSLAEKYQQVAFNLDCFNVLKGHEKAAEVIIEGAGMSGYKFRKYFKNKEAHECDLILVE